MIALIKEKKEKENVLTNMELINLRNVSLLHIEKFRKKIIEAKREQLMEDKKEYERIVHHLQA